MVLIPLALFAPFLCRLYDSRLRWWALVVWIGTLVVFEYAWFTTLPRPSVIGSDAFDPSLAIYLIVHMFLLWGLAFYFGFFYADGHVHRLKRWFLPIAAGLAATTVGLIVLGPYGSSPVGMMWPRAFDTPYFIGRMIDLAGAEGYVGFARGGNQFPPLLPWVTGSLAVMFVLYAFEKQIVAVYNIGRVRAVIDWIGERSLTILIWHMTALTAAYWMLRGLGIWEVITDLPVGLGQLFAFGVAVASTAAVVGLMYPVEGWDWDLRTRKKSQLKATK